MVSLTPLDRREEVTGAAMSEGLVNGGMVLTGMLGVLYGSLRNPTFRKVRTLHAR